MEFDAPKPVKHGTSAKDRLLKNPITTVVGLVLIGASIYMLKHELDSTYALVLGGAGLVALGLKDKA